MFQNDLVGVVFVYCYVALLLFFSEKLHKKYPNFSRKLLHILTGNIAFVLWLFESRFVMAFVAAAPFIVLTFFMSSYSPVKSIRGKTSVVGHGLGLVYYAVTWTVLAFVFFDRLEIIAIGILAMSYGDGFAGVIGSRWGRKKYIVFNDEKSYLGSFFMFVFTFFMMIVALLFYGVELRFIMIFYLAVVAAVAMVFEGFTPLGLDNLSVPFVTVLLYWFLIV